MKIEEFVQWHNAALNRKVEEAPLLNQRLKARLKNKERVKHPFLWSLSGKSILVYGFLLILFTVLNFILIDGLKKQDIRPTQRASITMHVFQAEYPGSISHVYSEAVK